MFPYKLNTLKPQLRDILDYLLDFLYLQIKLTMFELQQIIALL